MAPHVNYTMTPVTTLPVAKARSHTRELRYYPLFEQMADAHTTGFFANPDHYIEVARYGGSATASSAQKSLRNGSFKIPAAPAGCAWTIVARKVEFADDPTTKSVLYARIDAVATVAEDAPPAADGADDADDSDAVAASDGE